MKQTRRKVKTEKKSWFNRLESWHARLPTKARWFCGKSPLFWILAFYIIKGTVVTIAMLAAVIWVF